MSAEAELDRIDAEIKSIIRTFFDKEKVFDSNAKIFTELKSAVAALIKCRDVFTKTVLDEISLRKLDFTAEELPSDGKNLKAWKKAYQNLKSADVVVTDRTYQCLSYSIGTHSRQTSDARVELALRVVHSMRLYKLCQDADAANAVPEFFKEFFKYWLDNHKSKMYTYRTKIVIEREETDPVARKAHLDHMSKVYKFHGLNFEKKHKKGSKGLPKVLKDANNRSQTALRRDCQYYKLFMVSIYKDPYTKGLINSTIGFDEDLPADRREILEPVLDRHINLQDALNSLHSTPESSEENIKIVAERHKLAVVATTAHKLAAKYNKSDKATVAKITENILLPPPLQTRSGGVKPASAVGVGEVVDVDDDDMMNELDGSVDKGNYYHLAQIIFILIIKLL
jgi:hypothetical protein